MPSEPIERVVVLGASNVRRGLAAVAATAQALSPKPVDLLLAMGHGRSYGKWSSVPGRALPGILQCQLWSDLAAAPNKPTAAVITDIGNDLLYGVEPVRLCDWVAACVNRLLDAGAKIALTELPMASLARLGTIRYALFRSFFFPRCRLSLTEITQRANEVTSRLHQMASKRGTKVIALPKEWYGFDPIHIKREQNLACWENFFRTATNQTTTPTVERLALRARLALACAAPAQRKLLGKFQQRKQPCLTLPCGAKASIY